MRNILKKFNLSVASLLVASSLLMTSPINPSTAYAEVNTLNEATVAPTISQQEIKEASNLKVAVLTRNSKDYTFNGVKKVLNQPVTEIKGVTYIPFRAIAEIYGYNVSYDSKTKESIASSGELKLAFKQNTSTVKINNTETKEIPKTVTIKNSLMVPVRAWSELTDTTLTLTDKTITLEWQVGPSAAFKVKTFPIRANDTKVEYDDLATTPDGSAIIDEKWTGKLDYFPTPGKHTITRQVQDENGVWSAPFSVTINVQPQNMPPNAFFTTNKDIYKLGEPILYTDLSTDDYRIWSTEWSNNEPVFFTSGVKTISIEVADVYGLKSTFSKEITVTDEQLYTEEEYYYNFAKQGDKIKVAHQLALDASTIPYRIVPIENSTVVRLNSPEQITTAGIDYKDTIEAGHVRFALHKQNQTATPFYLSLFATNNNSEPVYITNDSFSIGGPSLFVNQSGKELTANFYENIINPMNNEPIEILPGETIQILPAAAQVDIQKDRTISLFADYITSGSLEFTSVISKSGSNAENDLLTLAQLPSDNKHVRGTFKQADRRLLFTYNFGSYPLERIVLGDKVHDSFITGVDAVTGNEIENRGNGAVKYAFSMDVKPNHVVIINGRGGLYAGSILVNNEIVQMANDGYLSNSTEAVVLYRTGDEAEKININFIPAPGSNLPLSIIVDNVPAIEVDEEYKNHMNYSNINITEN